MSAKNSDENYDKKISKTLSYLLRHGALKSGLTIRSDGFVSVQEVLKKIPGCTVDDIKRVVDNNDKQRFSVRNVNDVLMIRANQGHTITQVDSLDLKLLTDVSFDIIHGTYLDCYEKIKNKGLCRMKRNHIHFAKGLNFNCGNLYQLFESNGRWIRVLRIGKRCHLVSWELKRLHRAQVLSESCTKQAKMGAKCEICNIEFQDENSYQGHMTGKRHLRRLEKIEGLKTMVQRSVFIPNIPPYFIQTDTDKDNFIRFFSQFGQIKFHKFAYRSVMIEFTTVEPAEYLLTNPVYYENSRLIIIERTLKAENSQLKKPVENKPPETINDTEELDWKKVQVIFDTNTPFRKQLEKFLETISISSHEIETLYESTCTKLRQIFKKAYPKCNTFRFGSTVSGLGFKNCDLDIYVDVGVPVYNEGEVPPGCKSSAAVFNDIKRLLFTRTTLFSKVVPIPRAKTPIIKFTFVPTNIRCDISFKNSLAVYNSQLVKHYLSMDEKLRPAMMVLKYWVSNFELRGGSKMSKYALTLLFLFYCQQPSVNLVPAVQELKKKCSEAEIVEGWQVNFDASHQQQQKASSPIASVPQLLQGFFEFYASYDFKLNVVCPVDGMSHKKIILNSVETLPDSMYLYKEYLKTRESALTFPLTKPMCVQDPNQLNHNVTGNIDSKYLETFQKYCEAAAALCKSEAATGYKKLLPSLFALDLSLPSNKESKDSGIISFLYYANKNLKVGFAADDFSRDVDVEDEESLAKAHWCDLTIGLVQKFFERVLKLRVQVIEGQQELKQQKLDAQSDVHTNDQSKVVMRCEGDTCMWRDRKGNFISIDPSVSLLEKEAMITEKLYEGLKSKNRLRNEKIDFECNILKKVAQEAHLIIRLSNIECSRANFSDLSSYIKSKLVVVLDRTFTYMKQYEKKNID